MTDAAALFEYSLRLGDDALVLGHRLSEWSSAAPMLEEDIALSNLALDLIGQARALYAVAIDADGRGRDEDDLAYFRGAAEFRNCLLVEQPNGDFASTIARQFFFAAFMHPYYGALKASAHADLAALAAKAEKEMAYHVRHAGEWMIRLGDGTAESRQRLVVAVDDLWGYTGELFDMDALERGLSQQGVAPDRTAIKPIWDATLQRVFREATLDLPAARSMQSGGRRGRHSEHLGHMLAIMQVLAREHPDAVW